MNQYSVILPVRNGSNHIHECIAGILSQTYADLELVILENASTDNTLEIIRSFNDNRVKVIPSTQPLSMEENWRRIVTIPKKQYMTLIGHDDVLDTDFLRTMDDLIREYPSASLYHAHFRYIDAAGNITGQCKPMKAYQSPADAVHNFLSFKTDLMGTGFVMRSSDYDQIGGIPAYPNLLFADMELWIELTRKNYIAVSPKECFSYRRHVAATTSSSADVKFLEAFDQLVSYFAKLRNVDPGLGSVIANDSSILLKEYCQGITHRILRTPRSQRTVPEVSAVIERFREYGRMLGNNSFEPLDYKEIKAGRIVDSNPLFRALFLFFKKIYNKPVLKQSSKG